MASTEELGDVVAAVGHYEKDGVKKSRNLTIGRVMRTGGRTWLKLTPYFLCPTLAADIRRTTKALGFGDGQEVTVSLLSKSGKPLGGVDAPVADGNEETTPPADEEPYPF